MQATTELTREEREAQALRDRVRSRIAKTERKAGINHTRAEIALAALKRIKHLAHSELGLASEIADEAIDEMRRSERLGSSHSHQ